MVFFCHRENRGRRQRTVFPEHVNQQSHVIIICLVNFVLEVYYYPSSSSSSKEIEKEPLGKKSKHRYVPVLFNDTLFVAQ